MSGIAQLEFSSHAPDNYARIDAPELNSEQAELQNQVQQEAELIEKQNQTKELPGQSSKPIQKSRGSVFLQRGRKSSFSHKILAKNNMLEKRLAKMARELHQLNITAKQHAQECKKDPPPTESQQTMGLQRFDFHSDPKTERTPFDVLESPQLIPQKVEFVGDHLELQPKIQTSDQAVQVNTIQESLTNFQSLLPQSPGISKGNVGSKDSKANVQHLARLTEELTSAADLDKVNETMMTAKFAHSTSMFMAPSPMFSSPILTHNERFVVRRDSNPLSMDKNLNESSALLLGTANRPIARRTSADTSQELADMTLAAQSPWINSSMSRL